MASSGPVVESTLIRSLRPLALPVVASCMWIALAPQLRRNPPTAKLKPPAGSDRNRTSSDCGCTGAGGESRCIDLAGSWLTGVITGLRGNLADTGTGHRISRRESRIGRRRRRGGWI